MKAKDRAALALSYLKQAYPDARCALHFEDDYQCLFAIALSAQTSDQAVNRATPALFDAYPDVLSLSKAAPDEVRPYLASLGLASMKARNLVNASRMIVSEFQSQIPSRMEDLTRLPGVGWKTASVYLLERKEVPAIPVDTHVHRLAVRLGFAKEKDSLLEVQRKLEALFPKEDWHFVHLALIAHGRALCHSLRPACQSCGLSEGCHYFRKNSSTRGK